MIELTVEVNVDELLDQLKANREAHRAVFIEALEGYRQRAIRELVKLQDRLEALDYPKNLLVTLPRPRDYTSEYDVVIAMLEASVHDTIKLGAEDYRRFALDQWDWKTDWVAGTREYVSR